MLCLICFYENNAKSDKDTPIFGYHSSSNAYRIFNEKILVVEISIHFILYETNDLFHLFLNESFSSHQFFFIKCIYEKLNLLLIINKFSDFIGKISNSISFKNNLV